MAKLRDKRPIPAAAKSADAAMDEWRKLAADIRANGITVNLFDRPVLNFSFGEKPAEETK